MFNKIRKINFLLIFIIILLSFIGFAAQYSAGGGSLDPWAKKHLVRIIISLLLLILIAMIDIKFFYKYSYLFFLFSLMLLISVEIIGNLGLGAKRWISFFGVSIQPSEIIKITLILALSKYYHNLRFEMIGKIYTVIFPLIIIFIPFFLVLLQPDLGTSVTILFLGLFIMFIAGVRIWKFVLGFALMLISLPFAWNNMKPYQQSRLLSFFNPDSDPLGQGYQLLQSKIALGSGGIIGKGFLQGTQSYLEYLPEKQTDFIFTLIGEEFGLIGTCFIILLFIIIIIIAYNISFRSNNLFGKILSIGICINIFLYVALNMAMVVGLMPVVGIPLPLLSYGGTAMLSVMISFGLLLNTEIHYNYKKLN